MFRALAIDHISNDGVAQREKFGIRSGVHFYRWLIKNNYPEGYQTLCRNCNWIKRIEEGGYRKCLTE